MKTNRNSIVFLFAIVLGTALFGCKKDPQENLTPKITKDNVEVTATTATFTWTVDWVGNRVSVVEVSEHEDMSDSQFYGSEEELNKTDFRASANDLKPATKYYYRYWVWNQNYLNNKFVMEEKFFTTATDLPAVKTLEVIDITRISATCQGEILSDGGLEITERGVCWSTNHNPTTSGSHAASSQNTSVFSVSISDLNPEETYYVRAYAVNSNGTAYGDPEVWFITGDVVAPTVITAQVTDISWRTATGGGEVTDDGGATVTERGVCWSTSHNPDVNDNYASNGTGMGSYTVNMDELTAETTYYVRAYAKNTADLIGYGEEVSFQTAQVPSYSISVSASPASGGSVTGGGTYNHGQSCTLKATPASGYTFLCWTKGGVQVSTETNYTFDVTESGNYVASFTDQPLTFTINVSSNPSNGGTAYVGSNPGTTQGTFTNGQSCTVHATANSGYVFTNWTENGTVVSEEANYTFSVAGDRTLKANFTVSQNTYTINVSANPTNGGTVTGGGSFNQGQSCTVTATPETGFVFVKWTENGTKVSDDSSYTFTVSDNRTLVAQFQTLSYTISATTNPSNAGSTTGSGTYDYGQSCTLKALPANGYTFVQWTKNGSQVSTQNPYIFNVTESGEYVAHFQTQSYTITTSSNPSDGGNTTGDGTYNHGQSCTLTATPANGFSFVKWTKSGTQVSTQNPFTFNVTASGEYVAHFQTQSYQVSVSANPNNGGVVSGGGNYNYGQSCTVTAIANAGYEFSNWTEGGNPVSSSASYTFPVISNRTLVANFTLQSYTISVSANPSNGGGVSGGGTYYYGDVCTVTATAVSGYTFNNWTEGGQVCTGNATYSFTVIGNRNLIANFIDNTNTPPGAINGLFTVSPNGLKVYFSSGNLQYIGSTATWKFADEQWDRIGASQGNNQYSTTRDLFGWGTSGYPHRQSLYQPWSTSKLDYYDAYDDPLLNLYDGNGQADWGYNAISNGGNEENSGWRTLTIEEWAYVFNSRTTTSGIRYVKAEVNYYYGVILLPDNWNSTYNLIYPNQSFPSFDTNTIDLAAWETYFEPYGAVFLPLTGYRSGNDVNYVGTRGSYWSSSCAGENFAHIISFTDSWLSIGGTSYRKYCGFAVRLVRNVE
jgi:hypothetical protein